MQSRSIEFHGETFSDDLDRSRLTNNVQRVFALLVDGKWHSAEDLSRVGGSNWGARVRSLREAQFGSLTIEKRRCPPGFSTWEYRLDLSSVSRESVSRIVNWKLLPKESETLAPKTRCCPVCSGTGKIPLSTDERQLDMFGY